MRVSWFCQSSQGESRHGFLYTSPQRTPSCMSFNKGVLHFLVVQWLRLPSNAVGVGSIPGQEAKIIPHAFQSKIQNKQQTQYCKKFICCGSVCMSYPACDPMDCSTPCLPVPHNLPEFARVRVHWIGDAIPPSHPLLPSSLFAFSLSQHQRLFQWVSCSHQ